MGNGYGFCKSLWFWELLMMGFQADCNDKHWLITNQGGQYLVSSCGDVLCKTFFTVRKRKPLVVCVKQYILYS